MKKVIFGLTLATAGAFVALAHPIDFSQIRHWTGTGPNQAALVVQFNGDLYGPDAYVYGYRWENGVTPTGEDMFKAICANSSRLSLLTQRTGSMGSTVCGIGYGLGQDALRNVSFDFEKAKNFEFINFDYYNVNSFMGQKDAPGDNSPQIAQDAITVAINGSHVIQHPFDQPKYGYPAYDYDCWQINSTTNNSLNAAPWGTKWLSAWYEGYWSYWCANNPDDEWMYSGSGCTGRPLANGSVDGWSFTQFESAQVGGMGEGVAPCENGNIFYIPARLTTCGVDATKVNRKIGEGDFAIPVVISWGDKTKIDNIVYEYRSNGNVGDAVTLLNSIAGADSKLKVEGTADNLTVSFDANGDGKIGGTGNSDATGTGSWTVTEFEDVLYVTRTPDAAPEYLFYLPDMDQYGIWLPEAMTYTLSDESDFVPVLIQPKPGNAYLSHTVYLRSDSNDDHSSNSSNIVSTFNTSNPYGKLTYAGGAAGDVYLHIRVPIGKYNEYQYSNICKITVNPPVRPITSISFAQQEVSTGLNKPIDNPYSFEPADATYTGLTFKSTNNSVATIAASGANTGTTAGTAVLSVSSTWNPEIKAEYTVTAALQNPVQDFKIKGVEGDTIVLHPKRMIGILAETVPADADIKDFDVTLTGTSTDKATMTASMYKVNYWDENNIRQQFYELSGHRVGECQLTLKSKDGSGLVKNYVVKITEQDRTPLANGYVDGTIILNEEWYGHTNGGMNYITPEGGMMYQVYERENPGMSFGATSQYGTIWADKLIVASKQHVDGGDPLPGGGRLVVADAKTLKRIGSIDNLMFGSETKSGDGRAVVGATPSTVYVGTSSGIYIVDINEVKVIGKIGTGTETADLYSGQIGDMVRAGKYVFAIKQNVGTFVIDVNTDQIIKTLDCASVQGVTQSADGNVWIATVENGASKFVCIDPETLDENVEMTVTMPATLGTVACSWGAWRSTPFAGCKSENSLWFNPGAGGIAGGSGGKYYRWEIGTDPTDLQPVFDLGNPGLQASNSRVKQKTYGSTRYDDRTKELIVMTCEDGASASYRYAWTHFVDPATGAIKRTIELEPYYWFQSLPIFPDKYDATLNLEEVTTAVGEPSMSIDLSKHLDDADNIAYNINVSIADVPEAQANDATVAEVSLNGKNLIVAPVAEGTKYVTLQLESNGRVSTKTIAINVKNDTTSGIGNAEVGTGTILCDGNRITFNGFNGVSFEVYGLNGTLCGSFDIDADRYIAEPSLANGVYVLHGSNGAVAKIILNR